MQPKPTRTTRAATALAALVLAVGCLLRIRQGSAATSLWLDELAVVRNVVARSVETLVFTPLDFGQIVPFGFLLWSRAAAVAAPGHDWVYRVLPMLASIGTLFAVLMIGRRMLGTIAASGATALVALSPGMVVLAATAKPYSVDACVSALLMLGAIRIMDDPSPRASTLVGLGALGGVLVLFSFPAVLVAFALAVTMGSMTLWLDRAPPIRRLLLVGIPLGIGALLASSHAIAARSARTGGYLEEYWRAGFPESVQSAPEWLWTQIVGVYDALFLTPYPWPGRQGTVAAGLGVVGIFGAAVLLRRDREKAPLVLAPLAAAVVAAAVGLYPLAERLSLFLAPTLAVATAAGAERVGAFLADRYRPSPHIAVALVVAPVLGALGASPPPVRLQETRPLLQALSEARGEGDVVYTYFAANQAVAWYGPRFGIVDWLPGACTAAGDLTGQLRQLDPLAGRSRAWIVLTHLIPTRRPVAEAVLDTLRRGGRELLAIERYRGAFGTSAYLFDLADWRPEPRGGIPVARPDGGASLSECGPGPHATWRIGG